MNTRLQVEHPVTEMVLGLDLVAEQLRIAAGDPIGPTALRPVIGGHAIEVRLYSEDPASGYLPQTGALDRFRIEGAEPFAVPGAGREPAPLRLDSGVEDGSEVSPHYDPMLAKLIAWAPSRGEAASRLARALERAEIDGPVNNRDLLARILRDPGFLAGETDTGLLERNEALATEPLVDAETERLHALAAALCAMAERRGSARVLAFAPPGWRNNLSQPQRISFAGAHGELEVAYDVGRDGLRAVVGGEEIEGASIRALTPAEAVLEVDGVARAYRVRRSGDAHHVNGPAGQSSLRELPRFPSGEQALGEGALVAPMPGKVIKLAAADGRRGRGRRRARRPRGDEDGARADRAGRGHGRRDARRRGGPGRGGRAAGRDRAGRSSSGRRRLGQREEGGEAAGERLVAGERHVAGGERVVELAVPVEDVDQGLPVGHDDGVGGGELGSLDLDLAPGDSRADALVAEPQLDLGLEVAGQVGAEEGAHREHAGVDAHAHALVRRRSVRAAPAAESDQHRLELHAGLAQLVDLGRGRRWKLAPDDDPGPLESAEALREDVGAELRQPGADVGEALRAEQQLADDHQGPALADDVERA